MSFIKITDPRKREELIKDFIETRKRIKDNFVAKKVGEIEYQTGLTKLFKPVTETQKATANEITEAQKATAEKITSELLPIKESLEKIPAITFPEYQAIERHIKEKNLGPLVTKALENIKTEEKTTCEIFFKNGDFKMGDKTLNIINDDIVIKDKVYKGTPGLWNLIMLDKSQDFTEEDFLNYGNLLIQTNTIYQNNDPNSNKPKSSRSYKWGKIIKPIWDRIKEEKKRLKTIEEEDEYDDPQPSTSGTGLKILPSNPNALIDRFDLLFSSQNAGHTGVRNEIVSILDELKRQGVINTKEYKKLNSIIKK